MYDPYISRLMQTDPEAAAIERRRMLAQALMQQGSKQQQMTHPLQVVGNLANSALGAFMMQRADTEGRELAQQNRDRDAAILRSVGIELPVAGAPGQPSAAGAQPAAPGVSAPVPIAGGAAPPAVTPEQREMAMAMLASRGSPLGTAMLPLVSRQIARQERDADRKEDREWQRDQAARAQANADRQYALSAASLAQGNVTWKDETDENGVVIGQRSSRGQFQPRQDQGISVPQAQGYVARLAPGYAEGKLSPDQERRFESSLAIVSAPKTYFDPSSGQMVTVRPELPSFVTEALAARRARQQPGAAPQGVPPAGDAAPPAAAPSVSPAATTLQPVPGLPGVSVAQVAPGRQAQPPSGFERDPNDPQTLRPVAGGPEDPRVKPMTEAQSKSNMFGSQMSMANEIIGGVQLPSTAAQLAYRNAPEQAVNAMLSENDQRYFNAVRLFAAGILRKETGAAFTPAELRDVQSRFFPMAGDSPEVITQKAQARALAIKTMEAEVPGGLRSAGGGAQLPGTSLTATPPPRIPAPPPGFRIVQ